MSNYSSDTATLAGTYSHLVVGLDLSEDSRAILDKAKKLSKACGAKISLVHVVEPLAFAYGGDVPMDLTEAQAVMEQQAQSRLDKIADEAQVAPSATTILVGNTAGELHRYAEEHDGDLIVVGSHGRHGFALLLGSTANGVLHGANTDVLAVRVGR